MLRIRSLLDSVAVLAVRSPIVATFCSSLRAYLQAPAIIMNWPKGSSCEGTLEAWRGMVEPRKELRRSRRERVNENGGRERACGRREGGSYSRAKRRGGKPGPDLGGDGTKPKAAAHRNLL
jgi:hypothetical protein